MHKYGVPAVPNNVLITAGSQQGLDLIGKVFLEPGDYVITERPTYLWPSRPGTPTAPATAPSPG